jgi:glutathione S-transferase
MNLSPTTAPQPGDRLVLVSHALCPYVQRAAIALREKAVPFDRVDIDLARKPAWFLALSPLGKTPLLLVPRGAGFEPLFESAVICDFLDETVEPRLHPADALERARHRAWIEVASATLNQIWQFYTARDAAALEARRRELAERFAQVDAALGDGPWFAGQEFSLVDAAFAPVFRYFEVFDGFFDAQVMAAAPRVRRWAAALAQRASVRDAVAHDYTQALRAFVERQHGELARLSRRARDAAVSTAAAPSVPRHDVYGPIHKALRLLMTRALVRWGSVDVDEEQDLSDAMAELDRMLLVSRLHLAHEHRHVHPALEAAQPGVAQQAAKEHQAHREALDALAGDMRALRSAARHDRERIARQLYRALARFVADDLLHMAHEETAHNAALWSHYSDEELQALEDRIVADTEPASLQLVMTSMLPALNPAERAALRCEAPQPLPTTT